MRNAVIVSAARTAVGKAPKGTLRTTRPDELAAAVINAIIRPAIKPKNRAITVSCTVIQAPVTNSLE